MPRKKKHDEDEPLGIQGLLGVGLDAKDDHKRISRGPNFLLVGGSKPTHEKMQQVALKFNDRVDHRGKKLPEINRRELDEIVDEVREDVE